MTLPIKLNDELFLYAEKVCNIGTKRDLSSKLKFAEAMCSDLVPKDLLGISHFCFS